MPFCCFSSRSNAAILEKKEIEMNGISQPIILSNPPSPSVTNSFGDGLVQRDFDVPQMLMPNTHSTANMSMQSTTVSKYLEDTMERDSKASSKWNDKSLTGKRSEATTGGGDTVERDIMLLKPSAQAFILKTKV